MSLLLTPLNLAFGILILLIFSIALLLGAFTSSSEAAPRRRRFLDAAPGLLTAAGILGTFTGILLALQDFDAANTGESVPTLLAGMKTAFLSSVLGIGSSFALRVISYSFPVQVVDGEDPQAILRDLAHDTKSQTEAMTALREEMGSALQRQTEAIAGEGDGSLATQLIKLRTSLVDSAEETKNTIDERAQEQVTAFRDFAEKMAENNSKALIKALEEVIRDFNDKLTEQFGENFKQLNEAVGRLVDWQENYRLQMDRMEAQLGSTLEKTIAAQQALSDSASALDQVANSSKQMNGLAEGLEAAVQQALTSIAAMNDLVGTIASLRERALEAFPVIELNIQKMTDGLRERIEEQSESLGQMIEATSRTMQEAADEHAQTMSSMIKDETESLSNAIGNQTDALTDALERAEKEIETSIKRAHAALEDGANEWKQQSNQSFSEFDENVQEQMQRIIDGMGNRLASISEKLSTDYGIIADAVRELRTNGRAH